MSVPLYRCWTRCWFCLPSKVCTHLFWCGTLYRPGHLVSNASVQFRRVLEWTRLKTRVRIHIRLLVECITCTHSPRLWTNWLSIPSCWPLLNWCWLRSRFCQSHSLHLLCERCILRNGFHICKDLWHMWCKCIHQLLKDPWSFWCLPIRWHDIHECTSHCLQFGNLIDRIFLLGWIPAKHFHLSDLFNQCLRLLWLSKAKAFHYIHHSSKLIFE